MLSGIKVVSKDEVERVESKEDRKKTKKKHHHHKKDRKKDKRDRKLSPSSSSDDGRDHERSPVGRDDPIPPVGDDNVPQRREDWMTMPRKEQTSMPPLQPPSPPKDKGDKVSEKELNPYLKNGGDGLPPAQPTTTTAAAAGQQLPSVGDGGASWRMKALRRAQEQAGQQGHRLSTIVADRWGSLGDLTSEVAEREASHGMAHIKAAKDRRREFLPPRRPSTSSFGTGDEETYLSDVKSIKSQMRRPSEVDLEKMSWKRREREGGSGRESGRGAAEAEKEKVLAGAASALNTFTNDGSFMDQFKTNTKEENPIPHDNDNDDKNGEKTTTTTTSKSELRHPPHPHPSSHPTTNIKKANVSAAAALKAKLTGRPPPPPPTTTEATKQIALPLVDAQGRAAPGAFGRETTSADADHKYRTSKQVERFEGGERKRYYGDDDSVDLDTLVKRTKYGQIDDMDDVMAGNIAKRSRHGRFKDSDLPDADAEYDYDAGLELMDTSKRASKEARRRGTVREEAASREKQRQVREYSRFQSALDRCTLCFTSPSRPKHLTVAIGTAAYLALPQRGRLVPGHCRIISVEHLPSTRVADETTWTEIRNFKKCLLQMFGAQGMDVLFWETYLPSSGGGGGGGGGNDARLHAVVECVPVPPDVFARAPMYFKKSVDDATEEWAQHASKKMIPTSVKGLRGCIPPNFPYFHVEFGLASGFVHVIDNVQEFDASFGRGVVAGLMGLPPEEMHRRGNRESESIQSRWVAEFRAQFEEYDWTKQL